MHTRKEIMKTYQLTIEVEILCEQQGLMEITDTITNPIIVLAQQYNHPILSVTAKFPEDYFEKC